MSWKTQVPAALAVHQVISMSSFDYAVVKRSPLIPSTRLFVLGCPASFRPMLVMIAAGGMFSTCSSHFSYASDVANMGDSLPSVKPNLIAVRL